MTEGWKDRVYVRTQGNVDIDRDYPILGRYLGPDFFADRAWWDEARKLLTAEENEEINRRFDNLFAPRAILYADQSKRSLKYFELLMDNDISFRVLPTDNFVLEPAVGFIIGDILITGDKAVSDEVEAERASVERFSKLPLPLKPDLKFGILMQKVRQIQIERAIVEMDRVVRGDQSQRLGQQGI